MLTKADQELIEQTGMIPPDRLQALEHALLCIGRSARDAAYAHPDGPKSHAAAALRGKACAYVDAAVLVRHIASGHALHPRSFSREKKLARAYAERRRLRRLTKAAEAGELSQRLASDTGVRHSLADVAAEFGVEL